MTQEPAKRKVIMFDDEEDFLRVTKANLERSGRYDVLTFSSAEDIVQKVKNYDPDVVLLDMSMPAVGGLEACALLNDNSGQGNIPIIILSALEKEEDKARAYEIGVVDYITKPIRSKQIMDKIDKALRSK